MKLSIYLNCHKPIVISGLRRSGKSTLLAQIINRHYPKGVYYLSFEDERLLDFTVADFNSLYELFIELYSHKKIFCFDEIQNIPKWEAFVRRLYDNGFKFLITGSNASLLSSELATRLTGRALAVELYPFSFKEYLLAQNVENLITDKPYTTVNKGEIKHHFNKYLTTGGMPEYIKYQQPEILQQIYNDILYRDVLSRNEIKETKALRELSMLLLSSVANLTSYNKLKNLLQLGSVNTVKNYCHYLEDSYLLFSLKRFSYKIKQQLTSPRKNILHRQWFN